MCMVPNFFSLMFVYLMKGAAKSSLKKLLDLASSVINESQYTLQETRDMVFNQNNDMNKEIIWSLQFSEDESLRENGNQTHLYFVPKYDANIPGMTRTVEYGRPYARFKPTQFMSDLYDSSIDSRYQAYWRDTWYATTATDKLSVGDTAFLSSERCLEQSSNRFEKL